MTLVCGDVLSGFKRARSREILLALDRSEVQVSYFDHTMRREASGNA